MIDTAFSASSDEVQLSALEDGRTEPHTDRVDMREHDAHGTTIQNSLDEPVAALVRHAYKGCDL